MALGLTACGLEDSVDEDFPSQQIEVIVPWAAGGGTDQVVRQLAEAAEETCGVNIIVSNREGGGGATGHQHMANAEPDGYTVGAATIELAILHHLGAAEVTPDDVQGVMQYSANPSVLSVDPDGPYESVDDVLEAMQDEDETIRIGTNGTGGIWDIAAGGLEREVGAEFTERVPFDGGADMIAALLGGHIEAAAPSGAESMDYLDSGEVTPLAVMDDERLDALPDTPTLQEEGVDWTTANWFSFVVPDDTETERVEALNDCFAEAYEDEDFVGFMEAQGFGMEYQDAADFDAFMAEESETYGDLVDELYE